jgi:hypothetical protein
MGNGFLLMLHQFPMMLFPSIGQHAWVCYLLVWLFPLIQNPPAKEQTKSHTQLFDEKVSVFLGS